ncbi:outer membrane beta-barrel protein [uncultured Tenacibaculum sp.]|uniref:outer membrane beta-barrel protein n=1 Tax=uncultured Tenacibaculum sp. TaxID=174713 RepID=UPI00260EF6C1|nr:outer membrane beta-barrel protein [uncultured Tenacibaculum sp.]
MKKLLLVIAMVAIGLTAHAQDGTFNVGANIGLPSADADTAYDFAFSLEANYLFEVSDEFKVGPSLSYAHYFGDINDASFLPIDAAARFDASEKIVIGLNLGYAVGLSPNGNDGGFHYRPSVGYNIAENTTIQASYSGVSVEGGTFANIGLGVVFGL